MELILWILALAGCLAWIYFASKDDIKFFLGVRK